MSTDTTPSLLIVPAVTRPLPREVASFGPETPERLREFVIDERSAHVVHRDGTRSTGRDPLDVRAVLDTPPDGDITRPVPLGTRIGHVHLYVGNLNEAYAFYQSFGFNRAVWAPRFHMGDLGGGGAFSHRIAVNTWQGENAPQSPAGTARMRNFTLRLDTAARLDHVLGTVQANIAEVEGGYLLRDPSENAILLASD